MSGNPHILELIWFTAATEVATIGATLSRKARIQLD